MTGTLRKITGAKDQKEASRSASRQAAEAQETGTAQIVEAQREALEYLKEREQLPQQFREGALGRIAGLYGLEGGEGSQEELISQARLSPIYEAILSSRDAGEESILRNRSVTGGLRSGASIGDLTNYNQQLENQALLTAYNQQLQGLQGLAMLPSNAGAIAQQIGGIGQTLGQGTMAAGQTRAQGTMAAGQAQANMFGGLAGLVAPAVGGAFAGGYF